LLYGDLVRPEPDPVIPHPRMHRRAFVLRPLSDIAPHAVHPVLGKTIRGLLDDLVDTPPGRPVVGRRDKS
jgi:2-amino-4-hydroxy-6-hydroxymethyldihydropteridine diphosphokinase